MVASLTRAAALSRDYVLFVVLSCAIATFGLILNSGAVIIGAMLIAPLMAPILASALALVTGDVRWLLRSLASLLLGVLLAVALSAGLGRLVSGSNWDFLTQLPSEVLSRTRPTLFDLVVALAGGAAGAYALADPALSATLAGVAIATALMPPLCVVGIGLAIDDGAVWQGAALLFLANFTAIVFAGCVVFAARGLAPVKRRSRRIVVSRVVLVTAPLVLLVSLPLALFTSRIIADARDNATIRATLTEGLAAAGPASLERVMHFRRG